MRTITVKGVGAGTFRPDCIRITIELKAADADYSLAMELANVQTEELQKAVAEAKIQTEELKTTNLNVSTEYESVPDGNGGWKQEQTGYCCTHQMVLELPLDFELLDRKRVV